MGGRLVLRVLSYPRRHIRWKIIAPYAVIAVALAVMGTFLVTRVVTGSLRERFDNQLAEAARVTSDAFVRRERKHLEVVRSVSFTEGVAEATEAGRELDLQRIINPIAANSGTERVEILGMDGERVFGEQLADAKTLDYAPLTEEADRRSWPIVAQVLQGEVDEFGDKFAQIVETPDGYALYTAGPIRAGDRIVGVVLVGSTLQSFLPVAKSEALADVTVYDFTGVPLASTFAEFDRGDDADLTPDQRVIDGDGDGAVRERKTLYGRDFELLYGDLLIRDRAIGKYSVGLPNSFILSAAAASRWQLGGLFAVAMVAVLAIGLLIASSLTRPLLRLVSAARLVTQGDLTARAGVQTADEVGVLASSFDIMTERLQQQHLATIRALTSAIDARDPYTLGHSVRVGQLAVTLGEALGLPQSTLQHLEIGGYLHDIGKIGVRDSVLLKPGALTPDERKMIEMHPRIGLDILAPVDLAPEVIQFVAGHHEKLDGSGYPAHTHGDGLSIIARIASVADIYDALTTDRPYRGALTPMQAMEILRREVDDGHLDRGVVATLDRLVSKWERRRRSDPALKGYQIPNWPLAEAA